MIATSDSSVAADAQRAEWHRPEVPDHSRVDEHERRLGGEHHERGGREPEHRPGAQRTLISFSW